MIDYDNFSRCHLTDIFFRFSRGSKRVKRFGPEKCLAYLRVSWIGKPTTNLEKEVKTVVKSYSSVSTRLVFTSNHMLPVARKDILPAI